MAWLRRFGDLRFLRGVGGFAAFESFEKAEHGVP
jgi:hypothetical protein